MLLKSLLTWVKRITEFLHKVRKSDSGDEDRKPDELNRKFELGLLRARRRDASRRHP